MFAYYIEPQEVFLTTEDLEKIRNEVSLSLKTLDDHVYDCKPIYKVVDIFKNRFQEFISQKKYPSSEKLKKKLEELSLQPSEILNELQSLPKAVLTQTEGMNEDDWRYLFIKSFVRALDPHSNFSASQGIMGDCIPLSGICLKQVGLYPRILWLGDGPSGIEKLQIGDRIIGISHINGKPGFLDPSQISWLKFRRLFVVPEFNELTVLVKRPGQEKPTPIVLYASARELYDSDNAKFKTTLEKERKTETIDLVVLDLSKSNGGDVGETVRVISLFLKNANVVQVKTKEALDEPVKSNAQSFIYEGPLAIVTTRNTISAAEIIAGVLKDYHRALILGADQTYGKGTCLETKALTWLADNKTTECNLKTATMVYFLPSGISIQRAGVKPHIILKELLTEDMLESDQEFCFDCQKTVIPFLSNESETGSGTSWKPVSDFDIQKVRSVQPTTVIKALLKFVSND